jgi:hypothetical protein
MVGELSFFTGCSREYSARAQGVCTLYKIDKAQFLEILKQDPNDFVISQNMKYFYFALKKYCNFIIPVYPQENK